MNQAEILAFELLKKRGYKEEEIIYQGSKNPDFICNDGKRFEIKRVYGRNELLFTERQMKELEGTDIILAFNSERKELIGEFLWSEKEIQTKFKIKVIKYQKKLQITVSDRIYAIIKREAKKGDKRILTYAAILLSETVDEKDKRVKFDDGFG